jgi:hypothetical protein
MGNSKTPKEAIPAPCAGFHTHFIERDEEIRGGLLATLSGNFLFQEK